MQKIHLILGTILAGLGVILGAFGAHGLKQVVPPESVATYQTGVQYQMYHAFALLVVGILSDRLSTGLVNWAGAFFLLGIVLFSGSLYLLVSLKAMNKVGVSGIGLITPFGGIMFIVGWILLLVAIIRK
ncbi:MAG TPA: DUF423 domain-containing protein [Chitinophagaceae bacterium]|jgi:uncharacterized membrane protein YgdD (TMEM256/DUF423 family)|nr:DUF423 domain-containing protein [Chitinophagaceae bacterium]